MSSPSRVALTIATGKPIYIQMAVNLARSFKWWHKNSAIQFAIATDQKHLLPPDLSAVQVIELQPGQYGHGFSPKLYLDKLTTADQTLFIDADCLCVGPLELVFEQFAGRAVSVVGSSITQGEWFGNVAAVCQRFGVSALPKFNGGLYYLAKGELSTQVYTKARELEPQYDEIGLTRLRGRPNDELLMAIAMALHNQTAIPDDGSIFTDPQACPGSLLIDVLQGKSRLVNPPAPHPNHQAWYPITEAHPVLVHFLGHHTGSYPYKREELKLELVQASGWSAMLANLWASAFYTSTLLSVELMRDTFRPIYRFLFGTRTVVKSDRV